MDKLIHTQIQIHMALLSGVCTLQLPEASIQNGVKTDVGGAVTQPACSLHTLSRGRRGGGKDGYWRRVGVRGPLTSGGAGGG